MLPASAPLRPVARQRSLAALLAGLCAVLFAGCSFSCSIGGDPTVSASELQSQVETSYVDQTGIELTSISCEETAAEVGGPINCEATNASDVDLVIEGEITAVNEDDDKVEFDWEVASAMVPGTHYAQEAERVLEHQVGKPISKIECPERVELEPNGEFRCTLTTPDGTELGATVTMTDGDGGFDIKVDEATRGSS